MLKLVSVTKSMLRRSTKHNSQHPSVFRPVLKPRSESLCKPQVTSIPAPKFGRDSYLKLEDYYKSRLHSRS